MVQFYAQVLFAKTNVLLMSGGGIACNNQNDLDARFSAEPTDDVFVQTLVDGIANDTIPLSESDSDEFEDNGNQIHTRSGVNNLRLMNDSGNILGPVTSTPFARKHAAKKVCDTNEETIIEINVHDGLGMRITSISSSDSYLEVLEKTAMAMKRPNHSVEIGYEAPWSSRIGTKRNLAYISSDDELANFWLSYNRYTRNQQSKKRKHDKAVVCEIVFHNMLANAPV